MHILSNTQHSKRMKYLGFLKLAGSKCHILLYLSGFGEFRLQLQMVEKTSERRVILSDPGHTTTVFLFITPILWSRLVPRACLWRKAHRAKTEISLNRKHRVCKGGEFHCSSSRVAPVISPFRLFCATFT